MFLMFGHISGISDLSSAANGSVGCMGVAGASMSFQNICPSASSSTCSNPQVTTPTSSSSQSSPANTGNGSVTSNNLLTYENSSLGITVCYPSDWTVVNGTKNGTLTKVATFLSPEASAFIQLSTNDSPSRQNVTLSGYLNYIINYYRTHYAGFNLIGSNASNSLAGQRAYAIIYTYTDHALGIQKILETGTIIGQKLYVVQYIVKPPDYQVFLREAKQMTNSLEIAQAVKVSNVTS